MLVGCGRLVWFYRLVLALRRRRESEVASPVQSEKIPQPPQPQLDGWIMDRSIYPPLPTGGHCGIGFPASCSVRQLWAHNNKGSLQFQHGRSRSHARSACLCPLSHLRQASAVQDSLMHERIVRALYTWTNQNPKAQGTRPGEEEER